MNYLQKLIDLCNLEDDELNEDEAIFVDKCTRRLEDEGELIAAEEMRIDKLYKREIKRG